MKIPKKIKIGGHDVSVIMEEGVRLKKAGDWNSWSNSIRINSDGDLSESYQAETFMHEIVEAINTHNELNMELHVISSLSEGIFAVIRNNKLDFGRG